MRLFWPASLFPGKHPNKASPNNPGTKETATAPQGSKETATATQGSKEAATATQGSSDAARF